MAQLRRGSGVFALLILPCLAGFPCARAAAPEAGTLAALAAPADGALAAATVPTAPAVRAVLVRGLPEAEAANVRAALGLARLDEAQLARLSPARLEFLLRRIPAEAARALEPFGHYAARTEVRREPYRDGLRIVVEVDPGEPVRVVAVDVRMDGAAGEDRFIRRELERLRPRIGEVFVHADYEAGKRRIERRLAERGYLAAQRQVARVEVDRIGRSATIRLHWDSGPRHALGEARFSPGVLRPGRLDPLVDWTPGAPFHQARLERLQQRLVQLDYFALVEVVPDEEAIGPDLQVPIDIRTTPAKRTRYSAALSLGSDSGLGLRGGVDRRWVNDAGHKWRADAEASARRHAASTQYRIPALHGLPGWYAAEAAWREERPEDALGFQRRDLRFGWQGRREPWSAAAAVVVAREDGRSRLRGGAFDGARQTLLYPEFNLAHRRFDEQAVAADGGQWSATLRGGWIEARGQRQRFAQVEGAAQWRTGSEARHGWIARVALAATAFDGDPESPEFPASLRYFAGGDRSLRGYGYREVGPRLGGEVVGGLHRVEASLEHQFFPWEQWGIALFADAGDAFNTAAAFDPKVGVGIGLRWRSPVGPVGLDFARGLDTATGGGPRLHLAFGMAF
jgi:translocation and assembly module TamA